MEAPEYLDLDEIDFSDDISYSVTSLKTIPELCRRCDSQNEDRSGMLPTFVLPSSFRLLLKVQDLTAFASWQCSAVFVFFYFCTPFWKHGFFF
uniref:Synuclein alpha interacting protein n=1 Tax=Chrysemys picta bellii TaxID=8478 RepID=A0A8C3HI50_CHRPI